jgi:hypothetical protein
MSSHTNTHISGNGVADGVGGCGDGHGQGSGDADAASSAAAMGVAVAARRGVPRAGVASALASSSWVKMLGPVRSSGTRGMSRSTGVAGGAMGHQSAEPSPLAIGVKESLQLAA